MCGLRLVATPTEAQHGRRILGIIAGVVADFGFLSPLNQMPVPWAPMIAVECAILPGREEARWAVHDADLGALTMALDQPALEAICAGVLAFPDGFHPRSEDLRSTALELVNIACGRLLAGLYGSRHSLSHAPPRLASKPRRLDGDWLRLRCETGQIGVLFRMDQ